MSTCWPARCPSQPGTTSRKRLLVRGVAGRVSMTSPMRQTSIPGRRWISAISVSPVALLAPRVAVVVVAQRLPETRLVVRQEPEAPDPLGALPEVEMGDEQAGGAAVLRFERLAVVGVGDPGSTARDILEWQVRGVASVAERRDVLGRGLDPFEQGVYRDALPPGL